MSEEEKPQVNKKSDENAGQNIWAIIGKTSAILSLILAIIAVYSFFFPEKPILSANIYEARDLIPINLTKKSKEEIVAPDIQELLNKRFPDKAIAFEKEVPEYWKNLLTVFSEERESKRNLAFTRLQLVTQKFRIFLQNSGNREAKDVNIELPRAKKGYFQIDYSGEGEKEFERTINVSNIRPESIVLIDVWITGDIIKSEEIIINYPDGRVPIKTQFQSDNEGFFDYIAMPILIIENLLFIILIVVAVVQTKKEAKQIKENLNENNKEAPLIAESQQKSIEDTEIANPVNIKGNRTKIKNKTAQ